MKRTSLIALLAFTASTLSFAAEFSIADLISASKEATDTFATAQKAHLQHFVGYKIWKSGEESKVKIYVNHNGMNMDFNYLCHKHDSRIECHAE